jgi:hypothetical protein
MTNYERTIVRLADGTEVNPKPLSQLSPDRPIRVLGTQKTNVGSVIPSDALSVVCRTQRYQHIKYWARFSPRLINHPAITHHV